MSSVVIAGDTSGTVTLDAPAVAGTTVLTLPATSGTVVTNTAGTVTQTMVATGVAGTGPAFFAVQSGSSQTLTNNVYTKIVFNTETFDTNSNYNTSTYAFTPTVAGYYQINASVNLDSSAGTVTPMAISIYKNGASIYQIYYPTTTGGNYFGAGASTLVYCNGSTDYIEVYVWQVTGGTRNTVLGAGFNTFSGALVRAA